MLTKNHDLAIKTIYSCLGNEDIIWAFTGSTSLIIQGMKIAPNDIDICTDEAGAYRINALLKAYETSPVSFSSTGKIRSHFGKFRINGIEVEVIGNIQTMNNHRWQDIIDLKSIIQQINYKNITIPVLNLTAESAGYKALGRFQRADEIDQFIASMGGLS